MAGVPDRIDPCRPLGRLAFTLSEMGSLWRSGVEERHDLTAPSCKGHSGCCVENGVIDCNVRASDYDISSFLFNVTPDISVLRL